MPLADHPLRYALANELHARPFPSFRCPGVALFMAFKEPVDAAKRDRGQDRAHLIALLDRFGVQHPQPEATHYFGDLGKFQLKWEQHTEFVTYTAFTDMVEARERPFDPAAWNIFPSDWLGGASGDRVSMAHIRIDPMPDAQNDLAKPLADWFVPDSLALAHVFDQTAIVAGDFRIDSAGQMRFAMFCKPDTNPRRIGRITQHICEIEIYKAMAMHGLPKAREIFHRMGEIDASLSQLVGDMTGDLSRPDETLKQLLTIAAELEKLQAESAFRFGASRAYEAIVHQRIDALREQQFFGGQTFGEFMTRRFDPAMRTVKSTERRLSAMTNRAIQAGDLLRTRVDVDRAAQNQALLKSMNQRADMQVRLQKTVEGLSVVAISYYAVNLLVYLLQPLVAPFGISKTYLTALAVLPVAGFAWWITRKIRQAFEK